MLLALALLLSGILAMPRSPEAVPDVPHGSAGVATLATHTLARDEQPLPLPADEAPVKKPRPVANVVAGKRGKSTPQAQSQIAIASLRIEFGLRHASTRVVPADVAGDRPDPTRHLHPGRAPPVA